MKSVSKLLGKQRRLIVGLMSGTSADGTDAALVEVETLTSGPHAGQMTWELIDFMTLPYPPAVRAEVLAVQEGGDRVVERLSRLHFVLGHLYVEAVEAVCRDAGVPVDTLDAVACPGQTVAHLPRFEVPLATGETPDDGLRAASAETGLVSASTLQIGEPAVLAERLGVAVVSNFRSRDVVVGGTGAPLVPLVDHILYQDPERARLAVNIGGIANLTAVAAGSTREDLLAFDTGPGNMVMDALVSRITDGRKSYDEGGTLAQKGTPNRELVDGILEQPYFKKAPPKAAGREQFGAPFVSEFLDQCRKANLSDAAVLATAVWLTARSIENAYRMFVDPVFPVSEVIVSGGGAHNVALMQALTSCFEGIPVVTSDYYGLNIDAKEAVAFALLAQLSLDGEAGNVTAVTGASRPVILGTITPGDVLS